MSTILVVDDMAVFREPIAASLRLAGYETVCAADGKVALAVVREQRIDLILLDMAMPEMDGLTFLRALRGDPQHRRLPVILLTAVTEKNYIVQAAKYGVFDCMLKSHFSIKELIARVKKHLGDPGVASAARSDAKPPRADVTSTGPSPASSPDAGKPQEPATPQAAAPVGTEAAKAAAGETPVASPVASLEGVKTIKDLKPIMRRSEIQEHLDNCGELKGMSPTVAQILTMTRQSQCSIEQVARAIRQDHAVALKVLKLANSTVYTRGEPVDSVQKAVMRIGLSQIRQVVLNISVIDRFSSEEQGKCISAPKFWEHSIACGLIAAEITRSLGNKDAQTDAAFTMGLLHDVGRLEYIEIFRDDYTRVLEAAKKLELPVEQVESRMLLINHADAMDRLLHAWGFPKDLINPIAFHHLSVGNIRRMAPHTLTEVATLALANRLAHALLLGNSGNLTIYPTEEFVAALKLDRDLIQRIEQDVPEQTDDIKYAMLARSNDESWPRLKDELQDRLTNRFRPIHVSAKPEFDAFRILCDRLRTTDEEPPNIGIIHMTHVRERVALTTKFKEAEAAAGDVALPVIILSPNGELQLEDRAMAGRAVQLLPSPTSLSRFLNAATQLLAGTDATRGDATRAA
ncbi:MAG: HDOD domain-containing protein [Phycisphaeraceae bacterium]